MAYQYHFHRSYRSTLMSLLLLIVEHINITIIVHIGTHQCHRYRYRWSSVVSLLPLLWEHIYVTVATLVEQITVTVAARWGEHWCDYYYWYWSTRMGPLPIIIRGLFFLRKVTLSQTQQNSVKAPSSIALYVFYVRFIQDILKTQCHQHKNVPNHVNGNGLFISSPSALFNQRLSCRRDISCEDYR